MDKHPHPLVIAVCVLLTTSVSVSHGQHLKTSKEAPVREDSLSSSDIATRVEAGALLPLLDANRLYGTGYWKIAQPNGQVGYIYKTHVRLMEGGIPNADTSDTEGTGKLQVHMINVGQADAILIVCPGGKHQMVIDAGELNYGFRYPGSLQEFKSYLQTYQPVSDPIEVVVATHPHSDHIAGMKWLLQSYETGLYVDNGQTFDSSTYHSLEATITGENINRKRLTDPQVPDIDFCPRQDVTARILRPQGLMGSLDPNDHSVVIRLEYQNSSFLFPGDAEHQLEELLLSDSDTRQHLDVDWLKVGHHGSHTSSTAPFIEAVSPEIAAISSGGEIVATNSNYLHPRMQTLQTLFPYTRERNGIPTTLEAYRDSTEQWGQLQTKEAVYITNNSGDLVFLSDGNSIWHRGDK